MEQRSTMSNTSLNCDSEVSNSGKKCIRECPVQLTSLSSLLSHHRCLFLYPDTLVISKQKGPNTFKLKTRVRLDRIWISSSNTSDSFLIGWPLANHLVHFRTCEEKQEWFSLLSTLTSKCLRPLSVNIHMDVQVEGREQTIRRRIDNGRRSAEIVVETAMELGLPHTSYELRISAGEGSTVKSMQGPENVYTVIMHELEKTGARLSDSQKTNLDTCPIVNIRLILSSIRGSKASSPKDLVNSLKKRVLSQREPRGLFGRELDGPTPPQPVLTIVDHIRIHHCDVEGIFRKSPKQSTFKELRAELDREIVPDFGKYSAHVLASILKDYLRSVPGKLLLSGNYQLWMREVVDEEDAEKKLDGCRSLLALLPTSHCILLANVLKLLGKIASSENSRMTSSSLAVCVGPCLLDSNDVMEGGKKIPLLLEFLIDNAADLVPGFSADNVFAIMSASDVNANVEHQEDLNDGSDTSCLLIEECETEIAHELGNAEENSIDSPGTNHSFQDHTGQKQLDEVPSLPERPLSAFSTSSEESEHDSLSLRCGAYFKAPQASAARGTAAAEPPVARKLSAELAAERKKSDGPRSPCLKRIHFQKTHTEMHQKVDPFKNNFDNFERLKEKLAQAARDQELAEEELKQQKEDKRKREERERRRREEEERKRREEEEKERINTLEREAKERRDSDVKTRLQLEDREAECRNADRQTIISETNPLQAVDFNSSQWTQRFPPFRGSVLFDSTPESSPRTQRKSFANSASSFVHSMISQKFGTRNEDKPTVQVQPFSQALSKESTETLNEQNKTSCVHDRFMTGPSANEEPQVSDCHEPLATYSERSSTQIANGHSDARSFDVTHRPITPREDHVLMRKSCPEVPLSPVSQRKKFWEELCESPLTGRRSIAQSQRPVSVVAAGATDPHQSRTSCAQTVSTNHTAKGYQFQNPYSAQRKTGCVTAMRHVQPLPQATEPYYPKAVVQDECYSVCTPKEHQPPLPTSSVPPIPSRPCHELSCVNAEDLYSPILSRHNDSKQDSKRSDLQRSMSTREPQVQHSREGTIQRTGSVRSDREKEWSRALCRRGEDRFVGLDPLEINWSVRHLKSIFNNSQPAPNIRTEYA